MVTMSLTRNKSSTTTRNLAIKLKDLGKIFCYITKTQKHNHSMFSLEFRSSKSAGEYRTCSNSRNQESKMGTIACTGGLVNKLEVKYQDISDI